jgi:hypothetical protein
MMMSASVLILGLSLAGQFIPWYVVFRPAGRKTTYFKDKVPRCRKPKNCQRSPVTKAAR